MATRRRTSRNSTRSTASHASHEVDAAPQQRIAVQRSQQQMAIAVDSASAMLRGAEVFTQLQLQALQRAGQSWRDAGDQIRAAEGPLELIAAQNQLLMNSCIQAMQFGQQFLAATVAARPELTRASQQEAPSADAEAVPPVMQVWKNMMGPMGAAMGLNGTAAAAAAPAH